MRKIGKYLLEQKICDEHSLKSAIELQLKLREKGIFKPIGSILTESIGLAKQDVNQALSQMYYDIVSTSTLFKELSTESIKQIISLASHEIFPENTPILNEGDHSSSLFLIISGKIKMFTTSPEGEEKILAELGPADGFGEIALLTGASYKNSIKTITPTSLLVLSKEDFEQLCLLYPEVSMVFIKGFANRLAQKESEIFQVSEQVLAYQQFISQEKELSLPELIGQTRTINNLRKKIYETAENDFPVLIEGETGTEKLVVAGTIHKNSKLSSAPFLSMDAKDITIEGYGAIPDNDSGNLQLEVAQSSILFGHEKGAFAISQTRGLGLLQICRTGTVVIENVDKFTRGMQQKLHDFLLHKTFQTVGGQVPIASSAKIIATSSKDLDELAKEGLFKKDLLDLLQNNKMVVPPLRKRKSDLLLLVDFLIIMECFKTPDRKLIKGISPEAYQRIMEYDWPGNMDELQVVIRRAINLAQGEYLMPEDIFIGIAPPEGKYTINLLQFDKIKAFFKSRFYPVGIQIITATVFSLIFFMAFMGNQSPNSNVSLILVWGMWEPLLFISWFVGARIWCSVCPMGALNDLFNRIGIKKFKVPSFISEYGVYLSAFGLGLIIWAEVATDMPNSPTATGFLLLSIAFFAILSGIFFERRLWCRYLCPLGKLGAVYSGCSIVEWRANNSICNSTCKDNVCYKGNNQTRGCPLYQGPFSLHSNQNCIICGHCVKLCPNDSPVLNLRIPGHELWASLTPEKVTTIFVPVIIGTQIFRGIEHLSFFQQIEGSFLPMWLIYGILLFATTVASFIYTRISSIVVFGHMKANFSIKSNLIIHAIIPLIFTFEIVYQLKPLLTRFGHFFPTLGRQFGFNWDFWDFAYQANSMKPWQILFILFGMLASVLFLKVLTQNYQNEKAGSSGNRFRNLPIIFLGCIYIGLFVFM
jgi:transcriptional regulator with AAA-type ATPase domain/NAD-dependent dihydropyrimidine dehydrogenase PreA subunit